MKLALSSTISEIDEYCQRVLGIPMLDLMQRSGDVVADTIRKRAPKDRHVVILAGKGNNGGDAYAAAVNLFSEYEIVLIDVFGAGQKSEAGKHFRDEYIALGGKIINFEPSDEIKNIIKTSGCIVDAVFGTGFHGEMPENIRPLAIMIRETVEAHKIAVDVPLGINADNGSVSDFAITVGTTVELSYIKPGIVSYPARSYVGDIVYDDIGLPRAMLAKEFKFRYNLIDKKWVALSLPRREENSNKGTFGKLLMITGSCRYRGAAHLGLESALRGGVGLVTFLGRESLCTELSSKYPEAIYSIKPEDEDCTESDVEKFVEMANAHTATLIGSGSGNNDTLRNLTLRLLASKGSPLIIDADAINALASMGEDGVKAIKNSARQVILTPHPLEFARLLGSDVATIQLHRIEAAERFAKENSCIVVLKGAGTVITDGEEVYINVVGSSALAKAGSGDVLAGFIASFVAQNKITPLKAAALAAYYHAMAGDVLAAEFSSFGVTPSDLPREIARQIAITEERHESFIKNRKADEAEEK